MLREAVRNGDLQKVKQAMANGLDINATDGDNNTALDLASKNKEIADLLRKHGAKTGEELKAERKWNTKQLLSIIAEFERKLTFQRCTDGRARAKSLGKHLGRHSKTTKQQDEQMKLAHDQGQSYAQIGKTFGISRMSVYRRLKGHIEVKKESETSWQNNQ